MSLENALATGFVLAAVIGVTILTMLDGRRRVSPEVARRHRRTLAWGWPFALLVLLSNLGHH